jgi:hypothetical protein
MAIENIGRDKPVELQLNDYSKGFLRETAKWTKFLTILGFIGIRLILLVMLIGEAAYQSSGYGSFSSELGGASIVGKIVFLIVLGIYFVPIYYLFQFSNKMKRALQSEDEETLTQAFEYLKSHYKFVGIFTIVILSLYLVTIVVGVVVAATAF